MRRARALKMLTRWMAREWAQFGIQVNAVGPGLTKTDFSKPIWSNPEVAKHVSAAIPMGRLAEPEEIVGSVLFRPRTPPGLLAAIPSMSTAEP